MFLVVKFFSARSAFLSVLAVIKKRPAGRSYRKFLRLYCDIQKRTPARLAVIVAGEGLSLRIVAAIGCLIRLGALRYRSGGEGFGSPTRLGLAIYGIAGGLLQFLLDDGFLLAPARTKRRRKRNLLA